MAYGLSNGHVTDDVTWPPKVLWGSTVGYPSDSLASCLLFLNVLSSAADRSWSTYNPVVQPAATICRRAGSSVTASTCRICHERPRQAAWRRTCGPLARQINQFAPWRVAGTEPLLQQRLILRTDLRTMSNNDWLSHKHRPYKSRHRQCSCCLETQRIYSTRQFPVSSRNWRAVSSFIGQLHPIV